MRILSAQFGGVLSVDDMQKTKLYKEGGPHCWPIVVKCSDMFANMVGSDFYVYSMNGTSVTHC